MPKAAPTQVIVHRIELQETERKLVEQYVVTNTISKAVPATIAAGAMGLAAYGLYFFFDAVYDIGEKAKQVANQIKEAAIEGAKFWEVPDPLTPEEQQASQDLKDQNELVLWTFAKKIWPF